ncbi:ABC-type uncharacterized transport system, substrate-binding protein [Desulfonatronum thiosulfatophilum]|uniref:ABC-type uncharacterized transport system, substrate-binding protein n=1 Tax=Desulfonatronum thiosulfatophilum TaxID=617002 RepID=A0A1G6EVW4_9BACT|nr:DUF1007 family protein [Desulfonatronum thiosulfatophilum]SDB61566.1 ABC-type uncharacterized transport system, substrate-binding protein [Desulfonatronum thiosulfatophilum]
MKIRFFQKIRLLAFSLLILSVSLGTAATVRAHPHVWVDYAIEARFDQNGLTGFHHRWIFDEMFSNQIMEMFDLPGDGNFSAAQIEQVRQEAFDYLREYNYFIHIKVDGTDFIVQYVRDFHVTTQGHQIVYEFFVPCTVAAADAPKSVHLLVADMEYFVDMAFVAETLEIQGQEFVEVSHTFTSGDPFSFWGGAWTPEHFALRFHKAS